MKTAGVAKRESLVAYAMEFCSMLLQSDAGKHIDRAILFGSVARGDFDEESDIDLFIDTGADIEKAVLKTLRLFEMSSANERWRLKDLKNTLSVKVGRLGEWALYRDVISNGILLYGKLVETPKGLRYWLLLALDFEQMPRNRKMRVWRALYGYRQKIGRKIYTSGGLLASIGGKKLQKSVIAVPVENKNKIYSFLKEHHVSYKIYEIWSDAV